jgi:MSHA pilin protein MshD
MAPREQVSDRGGFTLIELVIAMVVLSIAVIGVYSASSEISRRSAEPLLRTQALAIAQSTIVEIQAKKFAPLALCPPVAGAGSRIDFSHICHYVPWTDRVVRDQFGIALKQFSQYSMDVSIVQSDKLGPLGKQVPSDNTLLITVSVDHPASPTDGALARLSVYRVGY